MRLDPLVWPDIKITRAATTDTILASRMARLSDDEACWKHEDGNY